MYHTEERQPTNEERATTLATNIATNIIGDKTSMSFHAINVSHTSKNVEARYNATAWFHMDVERELQPLFRNDPFFDSKQIYERLKTEVCAALQRIVAAHPDATPDMLREVAIPEIVKVLVPVYKGIDDQRREMRRRIWESGRSPDYCAF